MSSPDLPPRVDAFEYAASIDLWRRRLLHVLDDSYCGVPLHKFPEDLRTYEHLLWEQRPDVLIEIGTHRGGSALWFYDRLQTLHRRGRIAREPIVITIDVAVDEARGLLESVDPRAADAIEMVVGDVTDPNIAEQIASRIPAGARCMVVEDSGHSYETTSAALRSFHRFVPPGGVFVVEDGVVDIELLRVVDGWPRGVAMAIDDFLASDVGREFRIDRDLEIYGLTTSCGGFLRRSHREIHGPGAAAQV